MFYASLKLSYISCLHSSLKSDNIGSLPNNKFLDWTKFKRFADDKYIVAKIMISVLRVENIVGRRENAGNQHFSPFSAMFSKTFFFRVVKSQDCVVWLRVNPFPHNDAF